MRAPILMGAILTPFSIGATLMPTPTLALVFVAPVTMLSFGVMALVPGILQTITPNEMRGQVTAIFSFFNNLVAMMLGSTIVALFTDLLFKDPHALGWSLALTAFLFLPASVALLWRGLPHYRKSLTDAERWKQVPADSDLVST